MSVFQLLGEISANVLLMIMINKSSVMPDMSLDGIRSASILLTDPGFLRPSIRFFREEHSHIAHL